LKKRELVEHECPVCRAVYYRRQMCEWCDVQVVEVIEPDFTDPPDDTVKESER
jgi:hypothetical protein